MGGDRLRRGASRLARVGGSLVVAAAILSACSSGGADQQNVPVPTFPAPAPGQSRPGSEPIKIALPEDCGKLLSVDQAGALFAQPLATVGAQTIRGVPEPSVGRTERVACTYRANGQDPRASTTDGPVLFQLNIGRYKSAAAARTQWQLNANAERSGARSSKDMTVADTPAVLISYGDQTTLSLPFGVDTLTFVLPAAAPGQTRPATGTLTDLAQRILPALAPTQPPGSRPAPPSVSPGPVPNGPVPNGAAPNGTPAPGSTPPAAAAGSGAP